MADLSRLRDKIRDNESVDGNEDDEDVPRRRRKDRSKSRGASDGRE